MRKTKPAAKGVYWRPDSDSLWIRFSIDGVKFRHSANTTKVKEAIALRSKLIALEYNREHWPGRVKTSLTIGELWALWKKHRAGKRSLDTDEYRFKVIKAHFGEKTKIATITADDALGFRDALLKRKGARGKTYAPATVNRHLALLRGALNVASEHGFRHKDPMKSIELVAENNERDRICTPAEYQLLIDAASPRLRLAIVLAYHTAMRIGEIAALTWEHVDLEEKLVKLRAEETKTSEARQVPLSIAVVDELSRWGADPGAEPGSVVGLKRDSISKQFGKLAKALGIKNLRAHDLRHTALTNLRRGDVDIYTMAKISGHKNMETLKRYMTIDATDLHEAIAKSRPRS